MVVEYGKWRSLIQVERRGCSHGFSISVIGGGYNDLQVTNRTMQGKLLICPYTLPYYTPLSDPIASLNLQITPP